VIKEDIVLNHIEYTYQTYLEDLECLKRHIERKGYTQLVCFDQTSLQVGTDLQGSLKLPLTILDVQYDSIKVKSAYRFQTSAKTLILDCVLDTGVTMGRAVDYVTLLGCEDVTGFCIYGNPNQDKVKFVRLHNGDWVNFWWDNTIS
jgi:hypoxanthine phosphoribosyltransferase